MRKLYTDVLLENPFMVTYNNNTVQACANDEDTITIGSTEFVRVTDVDGHNVSDGEGCQLLLNDGIIYKLVEGVPESTNITVTDVSPVAQYTFTISPTPDDAIVEINGVEQSSVTVDDGTTVSYTVSKTGYIAQSGTYTLDGADYTLYVVLEAEPLPDPINTENMAFYSYLGDSLGGLNTLTGDTDTNRLVAIPMTGTINCTPNFFEAVGSPSSTITGQIKLGESTIFEGTQNLQDGSYTYTIQGYSPISCDDGAPRIIVSTQEAQFVYMDGGNENTITLSINDSIVQAINNVRGASSPTGTITIYTGLTHVHLEDGIEEAQEQSQLLQFDATYNPKTYMSEVGNLYATSSGIVTSTGDGLTNALMVESKTSSFNVQNPLLPKFEWHDSDNYYEVDYGYFESWTYTDPDSGETYLAFGDGNDETNSILVDSSLTVYAKILQGYYVFSPYEAYTASTWVELYDANDDSFVDGRQLSTTADWTITSIRDSASTYVANQLPNLDVSGIAEDGQVVYGSSTLPFGGGE